MSKHPNFGESKSKTLSRHDKEMGLHLLYLPKTTVNILTPFVPHQCSHLYPKLAGSNWTCYITGEVIRLGRAPEHNSSSSSNTNNKYIVDVDFCGNKQISRRHAEIKFNTKTKGWELRVYGRIGVKVNHNYYTKKHRVVPLSTMALIDIGGNEFVFVLPDHTEAKSGRLEPDTTSTTLPLSSSSIAENVSSSQLASSEQKRQEEQTVENEQDDQLIDLITEVFESFDKSFEPTTQQVLKGVIQLARKKSLDYEDYSLDSVLRSLVLDSRFKVTEKGMEMTMEESDNVQWYWDRPPSPTTASASLDTTVNTTDSWSDFGYDFMESEDHHTVDTNEEGSARWPTMNLSNTRSSSAAISSMAPTTEILSTPTVQPLVPQPSSSSSSSTLLASIPASASPSLYSATETESIYTTVISTQSQTDASTRSTVHPSPGDRTLSTLSFSSHQETDSAASQADQHSRVTSSPLMSTTATVEGTPWPSLEPWASDCLGGPVYSRGISLISIYSSVLSQQPGSTLDGYSPSPILATPSLIFYSATSQLREKESGEDDDDINSRNGDLGYTPSNLNQQRKRHMSDQEDRNIWTRFRTSIFRAQD